jgi:hypothetical protein
VGGASNLMTNHAELISTASVSVYVHSNSTSNVSLCRIFLCFSPSSMPFRRFPPHPPLAAHRRPHLVSSSYWPCRIY